MASLLKKFKEYSSLYRRKPFRLEDCIGEKNINLGCGRRPMEKFVNVDYYAKDHCDVVADLNEKLPFDSESADLIYSDNVFEHIEKFLDLIQECYRVLKPGGYLVVKVPYFKSRHAFTDPTHCNFFNLASFDYYVKGTYANEYYAFFEECFSELTIYIDPDKKKWFGRKFMETYALKRTLKFEMGPLANISIFSNITYVLKK